MTLLPTKPNQSRPDQTRPKQRPKQRRNVDGDCGVGGGAHPHVTKIYKTLTLIACGVVFGLHETKIQARAGKKTTSIGGVGWRRKNTIRITGTLGWVQA